MNSQYIKKLDLKVLAEKLKPYLAKYDLNELTEEQYLKMVEITREPLTLLSDITNDAAYFFGEYPEIEEDVQTNVLDTEVSQTVLKEVLNRIDGWDFNNLHEILEDFRTYFKEQGIKAKITMWAIRAAVTGRTRGADMCGIMEILGKDKVKKRIQKVVK